jgi:hypothetical protein
MFSINSARAEQWPERQMLLSDRLAAVARYLVAYGLGLHAVGPRLFESLTAPDTDARARLFRAGVGLRSPLSYRDDASALADDAERQMRGPRDPVFERRMLLAHLRALLFQQAHDSAEDLRREKIDVTPADLRAALMLAVVYAKPKSELVPWHLDNSVVENMIEVVLDDYFGESR